MDYADVAQTASAIACWRGVWRPFVAPLRGTILRPRENLGEPDRSIGVV
ncbi:MAG: hypothetical protein WCC90_07710 [Methylocella sp.]